MTRGRCGPRALLGALLAASALVFPRLAAAAVCAEVRLEIRQEAALEREAFDARLEINNNFPAYGLENFRVDVVIKDAAGRTADDRFFLKINSRENLSAVDGTGLVQPLSTATVGWLIIPSAGAGGANPLGQRYSVRADISYMLNGTAQKLSTYEDFITVKPQPSLRLEYMLPFEVFADEALTQDTIEPVEPFPLGARITNVGYGQARNFQINSGQPEIVENKQGLAIDFKLLGTYVGDRKIPDTLLIPFGDIPAGGVSQASWIMATGLSGRFTQFSATFTHAAELGGQLTSLIKETAAYTLLKDVRVDLPGRDSHFDFLVNTTTARSEMEALLDGGGWIKPDVILESDQPGPIPVISVAAQLYGAPTAADPTRTLKVAEAIAPGPWLFLSASVPDGAAPVSVRRSDGKALDPANAWVSRHFNKSTLAYSYRLNVLDQGAPEFAEYRAELALKAVDRAPAPVSLLSAATAAGGGIALSWTAPGEDGNTGAMIGGRYLVQAERNVGAGFEPGLAQVRITTNTEPGAPQSYLVSGLPGNSEYYLKLWTQDTAGNISPDSNLAQAYAPPEPPKKAAVTEVSSGSARVLWAAGNNWLPINYRLLARVAPEAAPVLVSPDLEAAVSSHALSGLAPNTTYFFAGLALNPDSLAVSREEDLGSALTLAAPPESPVFSSVTQSGFSVSWSSGGNPAGTEYIVELATDAPAQAAAFSSGWVAALEHSFSGLSAGATYYARAKARNFAGVETGSVEFGHVGPRDVVGPVLKAYAGGAELVPFTSHYMLYTDSVSLTATDAGSGVATLFYTLDVPLSTTTRIAYTGPFTVAVGTHTLYYVSRDNAGNRTGPYWVTLESAYPADVAAPVTELRVNGSSVAWGGEVLAADTAVVELASEDTGWYVGGGTLTVYLAVGAAECEGIYYPGDWRGGGCDAAVYAGSVTLGVGVHYLYYRAVDLAGNEEPLRHARLEVARGTVMYYVDGAGGDDGNDGRAPGRAFRTIGAGLGAAGAGDMVLVSTGVYRESLTLATDGVALRAAGAAVLDGGTPEGGAALSTGVEVSGAGAEVSGFEFRGYITSAITANGSGVRVKNNTFRSVGGIAAVFVNWCTDCIISGNVFNGGDGGIYGLSRNPGTEVSGNVFNGQERRAVALAGTGLRVRNNTIYRAGRAMWYGCAERAGVYVESDSSPSGIEVTGNIVSEACTGVVAGPGAGDAAADYNNIWGVSAAYEGLAGGGHDRRAYPLFVDAAGGDFRLAEGSLCLGAGEGGGNMGYYQGAGVPYVPPEPLEYAHIRDIGGYGVEAGRLNMPFGVAVAPYGSGLYVTDTLNFRVQKYSVDGKFLLSFGSFGSGPGQFGGPVQTAVGPAGDVASPNGHIFVADPGNWRVQRFRGDGVYQMSFGSRGSGEGQFEELYWIAVDSVTTQIYASDSALNRVQVFDHGGVYKRTLGAGVLSQPRGVAVESGAWSAARVYVVDAGSGEVAVFDPEGVLVERWPLRAADPLAIHSDGSGRVYVSVASGGHTGLYYGREISWGGGARGFRTPGVQPAHGAFHGPGRLCIRGRFAERPRAETAGLRG